MTDTGTTDGFIKSLEREIEYQKRTVMAEKREYDKLWVENVKLHNETVRLREAAQDLIDDVLARHPGEDLKCPKMIALRKALENTNDESD